MNFFSVVSAIGCLTPHFISIGKSGRPCAFITVSSGLAIVPQPKTALYSASKGPLRVFMLC